MKKLLTTLIIATMILTIVTACTARKGSTSTPLTSSTTTSTTSMPTSSAPTTSIPPATSSSTSIKPTFSTDFTEIGALSNDQVNWGPGSTSDFKRPSGPVGLQAKYKNYYADFIAPDEKTIYLTFDNGYEYKNITANILDTLKEKNVKAVFFITGDYAKTQKELVRRMIDEGHIVGNHSWKHKNTTTLTLEEAQNDILENHNYVKENYNYDMTLLRFPEGAFSERSLALAQSMGYRSVFWSFAYKDWLTDAQPDKKTAFDKITRSIHPGEIMLLHAVSQTNADILGDVIDYVRSQGYEFGVYNFTGEIQ